MKTFYLDYKTAIENDAIISLNDYYEKYDISAGYLYKLITGAPLIINVEGTYVYVDKIPQLVKSVPAFVTNYIRSLKYVVENDTTEVVRFRWRKEK